MSFVADWVSKVNNLATDRTFFFKIYMPVQRGDGGGQGREGKIVFNISQPCLLNQSKTPHGFKNNVYIQCQA